eukprot:TRINITY_DN3731_c0_g1_i1.p1 TRINITY_DN3731_c0_g1~~TRINITY_DN3731_c0_g1_i1.p1  ORF type:complete len:294 (+),score=66.71 TRINITY_DN3731_c0_g1_i1:56-883(+)
MATDDEKRSIITQFVMASPCHELKNVIKDVRVLVADDDLVDSVLPDAVRSYSKKEFVPCESPYGNMVPLSSYSEGEPGIFLDPFESKWFKVTDYVKMRSEEAEGKPVEITPFQTQVQEKVTAYINDHYRSGTGCVFSVPEGLVIVVNSEKSNPGSCWSGRWKSYLMITNITATDCSTNGLIENDVHYYEDGNIQMDTSKELAKDFTASDSAALAKKVVTYLDDAEREFHMKIDEVCQTLADKSLKSLRRRLPVSKQLFNFSSGAHKLAMEFAKGQ